MRRADHGPPTVEELDTLEAYARAREGELGAREDAMQAEIMGIEGRCRVLEKKLRALIAQGAFEAEGILENLPRPAPPPGEAQRRLARQTRAQALQVRSDCADARAAALQYLDAASADALQSLTDCAWRADELHARRLLNTPTPRPQSPRPPPSDRRDTDRLRVDTQISLNSQANFYSGFARNISSGGLYVATIDVLPIGDELDVSFTLPNGLRISTRAVVRWTQEVIEITPGIWPGMGVEFLELDDTAKQAINQFMELREPMFFVD